MSLPEPPAPQPQDGGVPPLDPPAPAETSAAEAPAAEATAAEQAAAPAPEAVAEPVVPPAAEQAPPPPPAPGPVPGSLPPAPAAVVPVVPVFPNGKPMLDATGQPVSDKSRLAAALLCWFVGVLGVHRFYVGKIGTGVAMLLTCGGLGVWALIDLIVILLGSFRDMSGRRLENW